MDIRINDILNNMSIDEKIGQLSQVMYNGHNLDEVAELVKQRKVGSVILSNSAQAGNDTQINVNTDTTDTLQKLAMENGGIPIIYGRDVIHGHKVVYPIPLAMAASFNPELVKNCYREIAQEAARDGIQWSFAPMVDTARDPRWGRCIEGSGEDPYLAGQMAKAVVEGLQGDNPEAKDSIAACVKHFVGYGASEGGRDYNAVDIGDIALRNYYLPAFNEAVKAGVATVMSSFNAVSGAPVSSNKYLLRDVLKGEFGFDGFVVSDWGSVTMLLNFGTAENEKSCAEQCLNAGIDMEMVSKSYSYIKELIAEGKIAEEVLDDAVRRIIAVKLRFGLFENPYAPELNVDYDAHIKSAVKTAEECIVLLKNKDNALPLDKNQKLAAVGPMLNNRRDLLGSWTLDYDINYVKTFKEVLMEKYSDISVQFADNELYDNAVRSARYNDAVIVFLGESAAVTGENRSVGDIEVPQAQLELVRNLYETGCKVIAVLSFGRPVALERLEPYCDAILYSWHAGTGTAEAVIRTLFGKNNPSGSLPMTILRRTGQIPLYYNIQRAGHCINDYYKDNAWSRGYEDMQKTPLYPFGYGLSYTEFEYGEIRLDKAVTIEELNNGGKAVVSVDVKNTGDFDGYANVQCYIRDDIAGIARPLRELKAFKKIFLKQGEAKTVTFELGLDAFAYYDADKAYKVDSGSFVVYIGDSSYTENEMVLNIEMR